MKQLLAISILASMPVILAGCAGMTAGGNTTARTTDATVNSNSNSSSNTNSGSNSNSTGTTSTAPGTLTANTSSVNFGTVDVNDGSTVSVSLQNGSASTVHVTNVSISGAGFSPSGISTGEGIGPDGSAALNMTFAPSATGQATGSITITSDAKNSPLVIALSGTGAAPVSHSVKLSWGASPSSISGYNVFRGTSPGGENALPINGSALVPGTTYTDASVIGGSTYYYFVTAVASTGVSSVGTQEASVAIPD